MWFYEYAKKHGLNINEEVASLVNQGLERNKEKYGIRYCPCKLERTKDNVCPCKELRETKHCHCGLFESV